MRGPPTTATFANRVRLDPHTLITAAICAVQIALALPALSTPPLWVDEAYSAVLARRSITEIHRAMAFDAGPPLYYDLLHAWRFAFGESEAALRWMSLVLACAVTIVLARFSGPFLASDPKTGKRAAQWAAGLWALSPRAISYAHEVRNYTLLALFGTALALATLGFLRRGGRRPWVVTVSLAILAVYTHNVSWLLLAALGLASLSRTRALRTLLPLALAFACALVMFLPWLPTLATQAAISERLLGWIQHEWIVLAPFYTITGLLPGGASLFAPPLYRFPGWAVAANALALACALVLAARPEPARTVRGTGTQASAATMAWPTRVLLATVALFMALLYAASLLWKPSYLAGRTDFVLLPLLAMPVGRAIAIRRWGTALGSVAIAQMLVVSLVTEPPGPPDERPLKPLLAEQLRAGDVILCTGLSRPAVAYVTGERTTILSYPLDGDVHGAHFNPGYHQQHTDLARERALVLKRIEDALGPAGRLWLVSSDQAFFEPLRAAIDRAPFLRREMLEYPPALGLGRIGIRLLLARYGQRAPSEPSPHPVPARTGQLRPKRLNRLARRRKAGRQTWKKVPWKAHETVP